METISFGNGWEGRVVGGRFPLLEWLGGSETSGSFFTVLQGMQEADIHLILAGGAEAEAHIAQWDFAMALSHPHLVRVLAAGRSVIDHRDLVYVVTERSYSNLAKIVQNRALKADSARETFAPVLKALSYLHENGVVHGHINLSNIQFADMKPKLSVTDLLMAGSVKRTIQTTGSYDAPELTDGVMTAAADTWSLGMTLSEAMTQAPLSWDHSSDKEPEVAESLPSPFREIVQDCLRVDPVRRCTILSIVERLNGGKSISSPEGSIPIEMDSRPPEPQIREQGSGNGDQRTEVDKSFAAEIPIPAKKIPVPNEPEAPPSLKEKSGTAEASEPVLISRPLTHFEDGTTTRFRIIPIAGFLLAVIALIAVVLVLRHKSEIPRSVEGHDATALSPPVAEKQAEAPAPSATNQTEPETSPPAAKMQPDGSPQAATQSVVSTPEQPAPPPPSAENQPAAGGEAEGLVVKQVIPTVSPGARSGMRGPVTVSIRVWVTQDGTVSDAEYGSLGPGNYFARLAQRAARSWKFKPPMRNGEAERSVWTLRFNFERGKAEATATEDTE